MGFWRVLLWKQVLGVVVDDDDDDEDVLRGREECLESEEDRVDRFGAAMRCC